MKKKKLKNERKFYIFIGILLILIILSYSYIVRNNIMKNRFFTSCYKIYTANQEPVFRLNKIILYCSADAIDTSEEKNLQNLNICQFSDFAIYIDNTSYISDLTEENTIKELYIDNISLNIDSKYNDVYFDYKNPLDFGKFTELSQNLNNIDKINFNIIYNNSQNSTTDYSSPNFYTDCSNPISLGLNNNNIVTGFSLSQNDNLSFNGSILKETNVDVSSLNYTLSFTIHLKNNLDENFTYNLTLNIPLDKIDDGYLYKCKNCSKERNEYIFFKEP